MRFLQKIKTKYKILKSNTQAVTAIEYGLIAALTTVTVIVTLKVLGTNVTNMFSRIGSEVSQATNP